MRVLWSLNLVRFCGSNILKSTGLTCNQINYIRRVTIHAIIDWILLVVISTFKLVPYNHIITNFTFPPSTLFYHALDLWLPASRSFSLVGGRQVDPPLKVVLALLFSFCSMNIGVESSLQMYGNIGSNTVVSVRSEHVQHLHASVSHDSP